MPYRRSKTPGATFFFTVVTYRRNKILCHEAIARKLMPVDVTGDAFHLAMASYHQCHFLLTWNCQNLANANKFDHIRRVNTILGLFVPAMVTPFELLVWENNENET